MAKRVLVSGASGFIGGHITKALKSRGDEVVTLTRGPAREGSVHWDPSTRELDSASLEGFDAVVHLAGATIAGLWTDKKKREIIDSRRDGTLLLTETLAATSAKPGAFISSGAIGIYGSRGDEVLNEQSGVGEGFLAEVVDEWEKAAQPARDAGIRTVNLRIGLVLGADGGMMKTIKTPFKLGVGGKLGSGEQWWSWVTVDDVVKAFLFAIDNPQVDGPYNLAAPNPVTNAEFTKTFGSVISRPTFLPAPKFALKTVAGEMADEMMLASQRVDSSKLRDAGFEFEDSELKPALEKLFG
jgi:uncharacterized protein (TIGR01777 family)